MIIIVESMYLLWSISFISINLVVVTCYFEQGFAASKPPQVERIRPTTARSREYSKHSSTNNSSIENLTGWQDMCVTVQVPL